MLGQVVCREDGTQQVPQERWSWGEGSYEMVGALWVLSRARGPPSMQGTDVTTPWFYGELPPPPAGRRLLCAWNLLPAESEMGEDLGQSVLLVLSGAARGSCPITSPVSLTCLES